MGRVSADDDVRRSGRGVGLSCDAVGLFDESLDDHGLGHGLDDLALDEDLALAVAAGHTEVGLTGFTGTIDDAAHDGDAQRNFHAFETGRDLVRQGVDVDLGASAGRAGDDLELAWLEVEALQDLVADLDLFDWGCRGTHE